MQQQACTAKCNRTLLWRVATCSLRQLTCILEGFFSDTPGCLRCGHDSSAQLRRSRLPSHEFWLLKCSRHCVCLRTANVERRTSNSDLSTNMRNRASDATRQRSRIVTHSHPPTGGCPSLRTSSSFANADPNLACASLLYASSQQQLQDLPPLLQ